MIHRLRTRDLFAFAGEIILSAERRAQLDLTGGGASERIKKDLVVLLQVSRGTAAAAHNAVEVSEKDIFCEIVKISYGKGAKNPVSGPTAFYEPKKNHTTTTSGSASSADLAGLVPGPGEEDPEMVQQNLHWSVGVVPQGKRFRFSFCVLISLYHMLTACSHAYGVFLYKCIVDAVSRVTPREFEETYIRVFCRYKAQRDTVKEIFQQVSFLINNYIYTRIILKAVCLRWFSIVFLFCLRSGAKTAVCVSPSLR